MPYGKKEVRRKHVPNKAIAIATSNAVRLLGFREDSVVVVWPVVQNLAMGSLGTAKRRRALPHFEPLLVMMGCAIRRGEAGSVREREGVRRHMALR